MPRQRGCAGLAGWELCCGLNLPCKPGSSLKQPTGLFLHAQPSFWFKPKERKRKKISNYPDLSQLQHSLFLATDLFSIDMETAKNPKS
jgi:hypothetical protein